MDNRIKEGTFMWREMNDEWYRIQTNSPTVIDKLKRRKDVQICGKTTRGSSIYWVVFRLQYKKPSTAKQSFKRLTGCKNNFTVKNGLISTEMVYKNDSKTEDEV